MSTPQYVDVHALQTVPYANLNRDDLGAPKTLVYGGTERTRVSSQSWKRVVRHEIEQRLDDPALRTRRLVQSVAAVLSEQGWDQDLAVAGGRQVILSAGKGGIKLEPPPRSKPDPNITSVTLYLPASGIDELAAIVAEHREAVAAEMARKEPKGVLPAERVADVLRRGNGTIQLMGRMLAELPGAEVDGAVQFAHAFTTHATQVETDFFTAVDDIAKEGDAGSAHMNAAQYSAGTFYRYANVGLDTLLGNLGGNVAAARELTAEFLRAFVKTMPSGKQNATAAMTVPDLVYIAVRSDRPVSFAPAFEDPVRCELGFGAPSGDTFAAYATQLNQYWGTCELVRHGHASIWGKPIASLGEQAASIDELLAASVAAAFPSSVQP